MLPSIRTPLVRLGNLFPGRQVYAKCEFLQPSGCFKIRGAMHLLEHLVGRGGTRLLVVPSMGNTAVGAAVGARTCGFTMVGVVPQSISPAKDEKLRTLGVELVKIAGGGSELLNTATQLAQQRAGYFVHPHLDPLWTDGYQVIAQQILQALPDCGSLVFPLGGGGLLMGLTGYLARRPVRLNLLACEPLNYPKYARFDHARSRTIADGLILEKPHPPVQQRISETSISVHLVSDPDIRSAMRELFESHGLVVEPSAAITTALLRQYSGDLAEPACVILTGANITDEDFHRLIGKESA
jgi:threonine dehydratase